MLELRPRQRLFVERALASGGVGVAPTGTGKTVCLSEIARVLVAERGHRVLWLQHRDELLQQNAATFRRHAPDIKIGAVAAGYPPPSSEARVLFASVATVHRRLGRGLREQLGDITALLVDEAHHSAAKTYRSIVDAWPVQFRFGATATPARADGRGYLEVIGPICDQITLEEAIADGVLHKPRCFVLSLGAETDRDLVDIILSGRAKDMEQVARLIDKREITERVIGEWKARASDRRTIVFCSTIEHAKHVASAFAEAGVTSAAVWGSMPAKERRRVLTSFDRGEVQVLTNAFLLTEGFDSQPVSCVVLLRPCSAYSPMVQMIGRGLRRVDPERYPGIVKEDCIVLDFGRSIVTHGTIGRVYTDDDLTERERKEKKPKPPFVCECGLAIDRPLPPRCPECGAELRQGKEEQRDAKITPFELIEIEIIGKSRCSWYRLPGAQVWIADGIGTWAIVIVTSDDRCFSLLQTQGGGVPVHTEHASVQEAFYSAERFLQERGAWHAVSLGNSRIKKRPTPAQLDLLTRAIPNAKSMMINRYEACCLLTWMFNKRRVEKVVCA